MPSVVFVAVRSVPALAMPKSATSTRPSVDSRMFAGLMSRWTTPAAVRGVERVGHLGEDGDRLPGFERAVLVEVVAQRRPVHELHDDRLDVTVGAGVVDRDDRRMREPGRGHRLAAEPLDERLVGGEVRMQQLHRHLAGEGLVRGLPHLRHAAGGDEAVEAVPARDQSTGERIERRAVSHGGGKRRRDEPAGVQVAPGGRCHVTPMTRGPPCVPMTAPMTPMRNWSRG